MAWTIWLATSLLEPAEPFYQGRSLGSWLDEWSASGNNATNPAALAIRAMGPDALPFLVNRMADSSSPEKQKFRDWQQKVWDFAGRLVPHKSNPFYRRMVRREMTAAEPINLLGADAQSAFPTLTNLFLNGQAPMTSAIALAGSAQGIAVLQRAQTNSNRVLRFSANGALAGTRHDLENVLRSLIAIRRAPLDGSESDRLRRRADLALARLHEQTTLAAPVLTDFLRSPEPQAREAGAIYLGSLGPDAKAAAPTLISALSDSDPKVRMAASDALRKINP